MTAPAGPPRASRPWLFLLLLLVAAALHPGAVDNVDSRIVLRTTTQLVDEGTWALGAVEGTYMASPEYGSRGPDGSYQMKFGAGNALLAAPFVVAGRAALGPLGLDRARAGEAGAAAASCLWFALGGIVLHRSLRRYADARGAAFGVLAYAFAGYAVVYARSAYLETPLTLAVLLAYERALSCRETGGAWRPALALGAACAAAVWLKVAAVTLLAGVPLVLLFGPGAAKRPAVRGALRAGAAFLPALALLGVTNQARFGDPLETGYSGSARFDHPLGDGLFQLLSGERGLLFHAPVALLGLFTLPAFARKDGGLAAGIALAVAASVPLYACFFSPYGGDAWGPRYLLPDAALLAVPATVTLWSWLRRGTATRFAACALLAFGALLQVAPSVVSFRDHWALRTQGAPLPPPGPSLARIALEKARGGGGLDLWPVRVARDLPRRAPLAWGAWTLVIAGAVAASVFLVRRTREASA